MIDRNFQLLTQLPYSIERELGGIEVTPVCAATLSTANRLTPFKRLQRDLISTTCFFMGAVALGSWFKPFDGTENSAELERLNMLDEVLRASPPLKSGVSRDRLLHRVYLGTHLTQDRDIFPTLADIDLLRVAPTARLSLNLATAFREPTGLLTRKVSAIAVLRLLLSDFSNSLAHFLEEVGLDSSLLFDCLIETREKPARTDNTSMKLADNQVGIQFDLRDARDVRGSSTASESSEKQNVHQNRDQRVKGRRHSAPGRAKTPIGKSIEKNGDHLSLSISALSLLINERLVSLRVQNPNSNEAKQARNEAIAQFEVLGEQLRTLHVATNQFGQNLANEAETVKTVKSFAEGVRSWWSNSHQQICSSAFETGLFLSAVCVCNWAGAGGALSVAVAGALVGGKPVVDSLKSLAKKIIK